MTIAKNIEDFVHDFRTVIPDGARTDFITIHHHVVLVSDDGKFFFIGFCSFKSGEATFWHREWVVTEVDFTFTIIPFVEWEVNNPTKRNNRVVLQVKVIGKSDAELSEDFVHLSAVIRAEEDSVTIFSASGFFDFGKFFRLQEFSNWTFFGTVFIHDVSETGGAKFPGFFSELVDLRTSEAGTIFNTDSFNAWTLEDFEAGVFEDFSKLDHFHAVAKIWFVNTVFFH